jgi:NAD(P)-dependent dehydrogenase (short-subunit alcohol dehydrogenase family)|tara:strand:- start:1592 stop:2323 length:732 start_codon:yes stop_codon:yes gene_type:complete
MNKLKTLITGANYGIGREITEKFAKEKHDLVLLVRNKSGIKDLKLLEKKHEIKVKILVGDLRNLNFINKLNKISYVDNVINNAAMSNAKYFSNVSEKDFDNLIKVNLRAIFKISQIFSKKMIKNKIKGTIISLSSQLGHIGAYNRTLYSLTKFGLEGLTKSMALDLSKHGIRVVTVAPTKTLVKPEELKKRSLRLNLIKKKIPLKKFSTKSEISSIVYFLTTDPAKSITGTSIIADGGWTAGK